LAFGVGTQVQLAGTKKHKPTPIMTSPTTP